MRHLDLFSGIGGFALAASRVWVDHQVVSFCDIEPFAQKVLKKHWPDVPCHDDIKTMKGSDYANIDLLTGGFPCQPFSSAGQRRGTEDDRHLWPEMLRVIREAKPRWVVGENVRGLTNWNDGVVFEEVLSDLEAEGYSVQSFLIPACAVDAPHRRDRIWIVAHSGSGGLCEQNNGNEQQGGAKTVCTGKNISDGGAVYGEAVPNSESNGSSRTSNETGGEVEGQDRDKTKQPSINGEIQPLANSQSQRLQGVGTSREQEPQTHEGQGLSLCSSRPNERGWPTEPNVGRVANGIPRKLDGFRLEQILQEIEKYAIQTVSNPSEILHLLWEANGSPTFQKRGTGITIQLSEEKVLQLVLCKLESLFGEEYLSQESKEVSGDDVRGLWLHEAFTGSPHRPGLYEQYQKEHPDSLQGLSRLLAQISHKTWLEYRRSYASDRVNRLKGLGNAIVPQVAEMIFKAIKAYDDN